jgi:transcription initiation factor TFIID TATA-box-binding protein
MTENACEMPIPRLQNIVATFCTLPLGQNEIDLELLVCRCPFMEFNSKRFAAVVIRLARPKTTCLLFASGKAVCTGAKTETDARTACLKYVNLLGLSGIRFRFMSFKVENIVAAVHCPFRVDLSKMAEHVSGWVNYEPSLFPGLIFRKAMDCRKKSTKRNTLVFICFQSGKCIITGAHSRSQILTEWIKFFNETMTTYISQIDYGSSGNYRVVQSAFSKSKRDMDMLKSICYFERSDDDSAVQMSSELLDLKHNQNRQSTYTAMIVTAVMRPANI